MFGKLPDVYYDHDPILTTLLMLVGLMGQSGLCVQKIPSKSPKQAQSTPKQPPQSQKRVGSIPPGDAPTC